MTEIIERIVTATHYKYQGAERVEVTDVFFNDGTKLSLDGHWVFDVGRSYRIEYTNGNPVEVDNVTIKL